jgi:hypothetical protein
VAGLWFSLGTPISSTNKTNNNHRQINQLFLKYLLFLGRFATQHIALKTLGILQKINPVFAKTKK